MCLCDIVTRLLWRSKKRGPSIEAEVSLGTMLRLCGPDCAWRCIHHRGFHLGGGKCLCGRCRGVHTGIHCDSGSSSSTVGPREFLAGYPIQALGESMLVPENSWESSGHTNGIFSFWAVILLRRHVKVVGSKASCVEVIRQGLRECPAKESKSSSGPDVAEKKKKLWRKLQIPLTKKILNKHRQTTQTYMGVTKKNQKMAAKNIQEREAHEYVAPELDWFGLELAEALPEEFVLRHVGTAQLVQVAVD